MAELSGRNPRGKKYLEKYDNHINLNAGWSFGSWLLVARTAQNI